MKTKPKNQTLSQRITGYLKELNTGILVMERRVKDNIQHFFLECGNQYQRPPQELLVCIKHSNDSLHIQLFHQTELLAILRTSELVNFFSGGLNAIPGVEQKTVEKVITYFNHLSIQNDIPAHQLEVLIVNNSKLVVVEVVDGNHFRKQIPLKELIQFFQR